MATYLPEEFVPDCWRGDGFRLYEWQVSWRCACMHAACPFRHLLLLPCVSLMAVRLLARASSPSISSQSPDCCIHCRVWPASCSADMGSSAHGAGGVPADGGRDAGRQPGVLRSHQWRQVPGRGGVHAARRRQHAQADAAGAALQGAVRGEGALPGSQSPRMCIVAVVPSRKTGCLFFPLCLEKCSSSLLNSLLKGSVLVGCALWQGRLV